LDHVSHRLGRGLSDQTERTHASLRQLHERLAVIDAAQANLTQLSTEMVSLKDILSNGARPDCCVKLPESEVRLVIDAKFPLEAFNALKSASGEAEIKSCEARLRRDVTVHVKAIAEKY